MTAARDRLGKQSLPGCRYDRVLGCGKYEGGYIDLPEPVGDIKGLYLGQTPSHDALVGLPDPFDHEVCQRSRLGLDPWRRLKNWFTNWLSAGKGNRSSTLRAMEDPIVLPNLASAPCTMRAQAERMVDGQFQGDGAAEGNAEYRGTLQTQLSIKEARSSAYPAMSQTSYVVHQNPVRGNCRPSNRK